MINIDQNLFWYIFSNVTHNSIDTHYFQLTDPEREARDRMWIERAAVENNFDVEIVAVSDYLASIALIGPNSRQVYHIFIFGYEQNDFRFYLN